MPSFIDDHLFSVATRKAEEQKSRRAEKH